MFDFFKKAVTSMQKNEGKITPHTALPSCTLHSSGLMLLPRIFSPRVDLCIVIKGKAWGLMSDSIQNAHVDVCSITNNKIRSHVSSLLHNKIPHVKMQIYFKPWKC